MPYYGGFSLGSGYSQLEKRLFSSRREASTNSETGISVGRPDADAVLRLYTGWYGRHGTQGGYLPGCSREIYTHQGTHQGVVGRHIYHQGTHREACWAIYTRVHTGRHAGLYTPGYTLRCTYWLYTPRYTPPTVHREAYPTYKRYTGRHIQGEREASAQRGLSPS